MRRFGLEVALAIAERPSYESLDIRGLTLDHWVISHVVEGKVLTRTRGHTSVATSGWVMIHPPGTPFDEVADGPGSHEYVGFDLRLDGRPVLLDPPIGLAFPLRDPRIFSVCFDPLTGAGDAEVAVALLDVVLETQRSWRESGQPEMPLDVLGSSFRLEPVRRYLEQHLPETISREDLARLACMHPNSLDRAFRAAYGVPPMEMLRDLRLRRACDLLARTDHTLDAVAHACGLHDAPMLSRYFRTRLGESPGAYRTRVRATSGGYVVPTGPDATSV